MRVASKSIYDTVIFNLGKNTAGLSKANEVVSSAKRINALSDDPVGLTQILNIKSTLNGIEQLERNIDMGKSWLNASERAVTMVQDLVSETKALCVQMASDNTSDAARSSAAGTVQNTFDEIVSLANTEVSGRYIFAGSKTDATPFNQNGTYSGDNNVFTIKIGKDATVEVGSDGSAVFQPSGAGASDDIFQTLSDLQTALQDSDINDIQAAMGKLDSHLSQLSSKISDIGSKMIRMDMKEKIFQDLNITSTERLSKIEDADITEAIIELKEKEIAYQAALASSAKVMKLSLMDYM